MEKLKQGTKVQVGCCPGLCEDEKCCCGYGQWQGVAVVVSLLQFDSTLMWWLEKMTYNQFVS